MQLALSNEIPCIFAAQGAGDLLSLGKCELQKLDHQNWRHSGWYIIQFNNKPCVMKNWYFSRVDMLVYVKVLTHPSPNKSSWPLIRAFKWGTVWSLFPKDIKTARF